MAAFGTVPLLPFDTMAGAMGMVEGADVNCAALEGGAEATEEGPMEAMLPPVPVTAPLWLTLPLLRLAFFFFFPVPAVPVVDSDAASPASFSSPAAFPTASPLAAFFVLWLAEWPDAGTGAEEKAAPESVMALSELTAEVAALEKSEEREVCGRRACDDCSRRVTELLLLCRTASSSAGRRGGQRALRLVFVPDVHRRSSHRRRRGR